MISDLIKEVDVKKLGERVKIARTLACLSQTELAKRCYISQQTLSGYECGEVEPSISILNAIARETNFDIRWFFFGELKF